MLSPKVVVSAQKASRCSLPASSMYRFAKEEESKKTLIYRSSRMSSDRAFPWSLRRKAGRCQEGLLGVSKFSIGRISATGRPCRRTTNVSPFSTSVIISDACFLNSVKGMFFMAYELCRKLCSSSICYRTSDGLRSNLGNVFRVFVPICGSKSYPVNPVDLVDAAGSMNSASHC